MRGRRSDGVRDFLGDADTDSEVAHDMVNVGGKEQVAPSHVARFVLLPPVTSRAARCFRAGCLLPV